MLADTQRPVNQIFMSVFYLSVLEGKCDFCLLLSVCCWREVLNGGVLFFRLAVESF